MAKKIDDLIKRIRAKTKRYRFNNSESQERLIRIGLLLENQTKLNIRRQGIVDTGNLLNSIQSRVFANETSATIQYGSYGVVYAALHEFGGPFTEKMRRAMFAKLRARNAPKKPGKGLVKGNYIKARPYIRPSVIQQRRRIFQLLQDG